MTTVCVIGAGWYGCHIGASLKALGFDVTVFEKNTQILSEASGNNQFRLHMGFHYPRHHNTRIQTRDGFTRFTSQYPRFSREVPNNFYAVSLSESLMDFATYRLIMASSGLDFREAPPLGLHRVDGMLMVVDERVLLTEQARRYFEARLGASLITGVTIKTVESFGNHVIVDGEKFDWAVDATWGHRGNMPIQVTYEPTLLLYYETNLPQPAITLVDGPLCSIYPTERPGIYTLSSVPHTPLGRTPSAAEGLWIRDHVDAALVDEKRHLMEDQISHYVPDFLDRFRFAGPQRSIKTKPTGMFDDRSCYVFRHDHIFTVLSGKIDTVFFALERILTEIST